VPRPDPDHQPPLGPWGHTWRLALCLAVSAAVTTSLSADQWQERPALAWADVVLGAASYVLVLARRRWPVAVAVLTNLAMVVSGLAAGPATLASVSLATRLRLVPIALVSVLMVVVGVLFMRVHPQSAETGGFWFDLGFNAVVSVAIMGWGMFIGSRRQLVGTLRERAERAETEQELRAREARSAERTRIAREMHDVLAHRISHISLQAGALSFRTDLDADTLRAGTAEIQEKANRALDDLRGVLGVLRDEEAVRDRPVPTYDDVEGLVDEARAGGMQVRLTDGLPPGPAVPEESGRAVYRIVQEGITNARKHAPGARLDITVTGGPDDGLRVRLRNPLGFGPSTAPGAGLGLIGLTERAELRGGRLTHRREDEAFVVEGWVPWGR
jgi:signal transduction histidine kinase